MVKVARRAHGRDADQQRDHFWYRQLCRCLHGLWIKLKPPASTDIGIYYIALIAACFVSHLRDPQASGFSYTMHGCLLNCAVPLPTYNGDRPNGDLELIWPCPNGVAELDSLLKGYSYAFV